MEFQFDWDVVELSLYDKTGNLHGSIKVHKKDIDSASFIQNESGENIKRGDILDLMLQALETTENPNAVS